jgi:hypothetical protein
LAPSNLRIEANLDLAASVLDVNLQMGRPGQSGMLSAVTLNDPGALAL